MKTIVDKRDLFRHMGSLPVKLRDACGNAHVGTLLAARPHGSDRDFIVTIGNGNDRETFYFRTGAM